MNNLEILKNQMEAGMHIVAQHTTIMTDASGVNSVLQDTQHTLMSWAPVIFSIGLALLFLLMGVGPTNIKNAARENIFWVIAAMVGIACAPGLVQAFLG